MQFLNRKTLFKVLSLAIILCISNNGYSKVKQWQVDRYSIIKYSAQLHQRNETIPWDKPVDYYCNLLHWIIEDTKKLHDDVNNNLYDSDENLIANGYKTPKGLRYSFRITAFCITDRILEKVPQQQKKNVRQQIINFHRRYLMEGTNVNIPSEQYKYNLDQIYKDFINNVIPQKKLN